MLGLVKHVTYVDGVWFDQAISGRSYADIGIASTPGEMALLDRLRETVNVDVYVLQVVRNPYDTIATMYRGAPNRALTDVVDLFFQLAATAHDVRRRVDRARFHVVHHDALFADPRPAVTGLCEFLGLPAADDHLDACCAVVNTSPHRSRDVVSWTPEILEQIDTRSAAEGSLQRYRFDESERATR